MGHIESFCKCIQSLDDALDDLSPVLETSVDQLIFATVGSLVEQAQATKVLFEQNQQKSALIIFRSISETAIHLINLCYFDQEYVDRMVVNAHEETRSKHQFCLNELDLSLTERAFHQSRVDHHKAERDAKRAQRGFRAEKTGTQKTYVLADCKNDYLSYKQLCGRTHSDIISLIKDHLEEVDGGLITIGKPLEQADLDHALRFATEMLLISLMTTFEYYEKKSDHMASAFEHNNEMLDKLDSLKATAT